jgi:demethylmenaquinone methyltransferase/2-methoxy-6-polyprenyl-1,4-benzoquinol methylase
MREGSGDVELDRLIGEQQAYYRARAPHCLAEALVPLGAAEAGELRRDLGAVFDQHFRGDVLELACGPGTWTAMMAERARSLTAVDGAPEMLEIAYERAAGDHVRFIEADLFEWTPERPYDAVFFGFWLSHVPEERFDAFWEKVRDALEPDGRVVFVDDAGRSDEELVYGADSSVIERVLRDGSRHRIVKMAHTPDALRRRLAGLGWSFEMRAAEPFFWGVGTRS